MSLSCTLSGTRRRTEAPPPGTTLFPPERSSRPHLGLVLVLRVSSFSSVSGKGRRVWYAREGERVKDELKKITTL